MHSLHLFNCVFLGFGLVKDPEFKPDLVASKSYAAAGLCSWVLNIVTFYKVYCEVEPKRQALTKANAELAAAQEKLAAIKSKINVSCWIRLRTQEMKNLFAVLQVCLFKHNPEAVFWYRFIKKHCSLKIFFFYFKGFD